MPTVCLKMSVGGGEGAWFWCGHSCDLGTLWSSAGLPVMEIAWGPGGTQTGGLCLWWAGARLSSWNFSSGPRVILISPGCCCQAELESRAPLPIYG